MRAREIAEIIGGRLFGSGDVEVTAAADIASAGPGQVAFIQGDPGDIEITAGCVIVGEGCEEVAGAESFIAVRNPKLAFARVAARLHPPKRREPEIHPSAVIAPDAKIGEGVFIGAFCTVGERSSIGSGTQLRAGAKVGDGVAIGNDCVVHPNVFVEDGSTLGDRVILHAGVVVGADGFGYVRDEEGEYQKFPQIGTVVIESDVEVGPNTCIDRGALGETRIGAGTKIDNLVQVGHNVQIGKRCVIAAQTGISGSVTIEDDCVIGGQVGFGDHVRVQSGAVIGSQAGVLPGKIVRPGVWWGTPIQPLDEYKRQNAHVKGLERLKKELRDLKKALEKIKEGNEDQ